MPDILIVGGLGDTSRDDHDELLLMNTSKAYQLKCHYPKDFTKGTFTGLVSGAMSGNLGDGRPIICGGTLKSLSNLGSQADKYNKRCWIYDLTQRIWMGTITM